MHACPSDAAYDLLESAARYAVKPFSDAFAHAQECREVVQWIILRGTIGDEQNEAQELVRAALARLPVGCPRKQMERAREEGLAPLVARIHARERMEAAKAEERRRRNEAERRVEWQLSHIDRYLQEAYEYDGYSGVRKRFDDARRLKEQLRPQLLEECLADPSLDDEDIRSRIEELIDELL